MSSRNFKTNQLVLAALMTALTAVCAQLQIPLAMVPISLATFAVYLCGALLPPRFAALSMVAYALLGAVGVPVFAGFSAGPSILFGPTGGYIVGYAVCATAIALVLRRMGVTHRSLCLAMLLGTALCYLLGTAWFMVVTGWTLGKALTACVFPFLPGDALKIALAVILSMRLRKIISSL